MKFRVLYRSPDQTTTGYFTEVNTTDTADAIWQTAKTLDPSAILVGVIAEDPTTAAIATPAAEGSTDAEA